MVPCAGLQVRFSLAKTGMMKDFAGFWSVQPYSQQALESADIGSSPRVEAPWWQPKSAFANFSSEFSSCSRERAATTLSSWDAASLECRAHSWQLGNEPPQDVKGDRLPIIACTRSTVQLLVSGSPGTHQSLQYLPTFVQAAGAIQASTPWLGRCQCMHPMSWGFTGTR